MLCLPHGDDWLTVSAILGWNGDVDLCNMRKITVLPCCPYFELNQINVKNNLKVYIN